MSHRGKRERPPNPDPLDLRRFDGLTMAGGCPDCDAVQELDATNAPVYIVVTRHDDGCPTLARYEGRSAS